MKKLFLTLLGTMLFVCNVNAQVLKGDMNGNGTLTVSDVTSLVDHILKGKKEYASSGVTAANNEILSTWYVSKVDFITFSSTTAKYSGTTYNKYAYYPAVNVIFLYGMDGAVKQTFIVKDKTDTSMTLLLPNGETKKYYSTCPSTPVESITLKTGSTSLYTPYTPSAIPGETTTITASVLPDFADNKEVEWTITQDMSTTKSITKVAETGSSITVRAARSGGATITATAKDGSGVSASIHIDAKARPTVKAVDLGTGVKWASMNVGADAPEDFGRYYAWGETSAYGEAPSAYPASFTGTKNSGYTSMTTKTEFMWSTYKYCQGSYKTMTRYNDVDNITTLYMEDDAARANMGGDWRMPTKEEAQKLAKECYWQYVTSYNGKNVKGYIVYKVKNIADKGKVTNSKNSPTLAATYSVSDTHIFLPEAGTYYYNDMTMSKTEFSGGDGKYWISSNKNQSSGYAAILLFYSWDNYISINNRERSEGLPIRAVCP